MKTKLIKLSNLKNIFNYSFKIYKREFSSFILPLVTITFTTLIVSTALLITKGSEGYILSKNKELVGGDIKIESNNLLNYQEIESILGFSILNKNKTEKVSFSSLVQSGEKFSTVNVSVIDNLYPLYGKLIIKNKDFVYPKEDGVYIDKALVDKLNIKEGGVLYLNNVQYKIEGIVEYSPDTLLAGFTFFPKIIISKEGFLKSNLNSKLLKADYSVSVSGISLKKDEYTFLKEKGREFKLDIDFANEPGGGVVRGLANVNKFIIIAVLISCVLASVNIYAGVLYLVKRLRRSLAILSAMGLNSSSLGFIVALTLIYTLTISVFSGLIGSIFVYEFIQKYILSNYDVLLPKSSFIYIFTLTSLLIIFTSLASFIPNLKSILSLNPKILLSGGEDIKSYKTKKELILTTLISFLPLLAVTIYLLDNFLLGLYSVFAIVFIYLFLAFVFYIFILFVYKKRNNFNFLIRSIVSIKYKDGLFGIVSVTSLYIALTSIATLILLQTTLYNFLTNDLSNKIPSLYLIDVQKSQITNLKKIEPDLNLFPNVGARIVSIDGIKIQDELKKDNPKFTRELGREFSLSYTDKLNESEKITEGKTLNNIKNEVSVDSEFASRANIKIDSIINFNIQGFDLESRVTSIRKTERNSGLPFFYFLFNTKDLIDFPATYFGYGYFNEEKISQLSKVLIKDYTNVSVINTKEAGEILISITQTLSLLVLIIATPPVILSIFLVTTLIILSFTSKRKMTAQFLALGSSNAFINKLFYIESSFFTIVSSFFAYLTAFIATFIISTYYLNINSYSVYSNELIITLCAIIFLIVLITFLLSVFDKKSLKDLLSYEEI